MKSKHIILISTLSLIISCLSVSLSAMDWSDPHEWARVLEAIRASSARDAQQESTSSTTSSSRKRTRTEAAREQREESGERNLFRNIRARLLREGAGSTTSNTTTTTSTSTTVSSATTSDVPVSEESAGEATLVATNALPGLPNETAMQIYWFLDEPSRRAFRRSSQAAAELTARYVPFRLTLSDLTEENLERNQARYQEARYLIIEKTSDIESDEEEVEEAISDYQVYLLAEYFPNLMGLNLTNTGITGHQLGIIAENFENLRLLNLESNNLQPVDFGNLRYAAFAESLETLIIGGNTLSSAVARLIGEVFTRLRHLDISYYYRSAQERVLSMEPDFMLGELLSDLGPVTRNIVAELSTAPLASTLEYLDLSQTGVPYPLLDGDDNKTPSSNTTNSELESQPSILEIVGNAFSNLVELNLSENLLERQEITQLANTPLAETLEGLDLSDNSFGREFRAALRILATRFSKLKRLNLTRPGIDRAINAQDIQIFTPDNTGGRIISLVLEETQITPDAVRALSTAFPHLEELNLSFNRTVTSELLEELITNLPNLRILIAHHITMTDEQKEAVQQKAKAHKYLEINI